MTVKAVMIRANKWSRYRPTSAIDKNGGTRTFKFDRGLLMGDHNSFFEMSICEEQGKITSIVKLNYENFLVHKLRMRIEISPYSPEYRIK
jgi:hypothetical protein